MSESIVYVGGARIHLLRQGTGSPLLYIHGSGDAGGWLPAQSELASHYTVYRPDLPGYNGSDRRPDITSVAEMAASVWQLLDEVFVGEVRIIGSSLGGWIAAEMAAVNPSRVSHLVLLDAVGLEPSGGFPVDQFSMSGPEIVRAVYHSDDLRAAVGADTAERLKNPGAAERMAGNASMTRLLGEHPYFHDPSLPARLGGVEAKTLIVWGADDGLVPVSCGLLYEQLIPDARLVVLADCGHLPLVEQPAAALAEIVPFLAS
ncbi:MAG: alpha/beta hydrolase [Subtercola sp.]|nr:alpha/beta hydrolase [Subtercola sp.]